MFCEILSFFSLFVFFISFSAYFVALCIQSIQNKVILCRSGLCRKTMATLENCDAIFSFLMFL